MINNTEPPRNARRIWRVANLRPGKQGLAIRLEQLPELMLALAKVEQTIVRESEAA